MTRVRTEWKVRDRAVTIGERTLIVAVLNVTPDSFTDGGKYTDPDRACRRAFELAEQGADILDVGAESTRPGSERISADDEMRRLLPIVNLLRKREFPLPISVDTYKSEVAEAALKAGAHIVNDVSALTWDVNLAKVVAQHDAGLILNHMRGTPQTWAKLGPLPDVMATILGELEASVHRAVRAGVDRSRIVVDPGLGFGKRREQNSEILARLAQMRKLMLPVLVGPSRKSFLAQEDPAAREFATAAAVAVCVQAGAALVRVHDVAAIKPAVQVSDAIFEAIPEPELPAEKPAPPARVSNEGRPVRPPERPQPDRPARPPRPPIGPDRSEPRQPRNDRPSGPPFQRQDRPDFRNNDRPDFRNNNRPDFRNNERPSRGPNDRKGRGDSPSSRRRP